MIYAGIGSRLCPVSVLNLMTEIGMYLSSYGWVLRSGGAAGADTAFEQGHDTGHGKKEIYLPSQRYRQHPSQLYVSCETINWAKVEELAKVVWKERKDRNCEWDYLKSFTQHNMIRDVTQITGMNFKDWTDIVICWTQDGLPSGGTGMAMWTANHITSVTGKVIPIINLQKESHRIAVKNILKGTDPALLIQHMKEYPNEGFD